MKMPAAPFKKVGSIWLPSGVVFDIWSNYAIAIPALSQRDPICESASPKLPGAYWSLVNEMFRNAGLIPEGRYLHWVGKQTEIDHVCTCFGILERGE